MTRGKSHTYTRREFLGAIAAGSVTLAGAGLPCLAAPDPAPAVKPISGSWISVWFDDRRHFYWNDPCLKFTEAQWGQLVRDQADAGMEYLVLLAIAKGGKAFYDTTLLPKLEMACADPIGAMLTSADQCGVKFFISSDWYAAWDDKALRDPERVRLRHQMMAEVAGRYAHHPSFHGWYWPNEACLGPYFTDDFMAYVHDSSAEARRLTPKAQTLIAPFGTSLCVDDDRFARQLEKLDVDIIAYQDEVGCLRMTPEQSEKAFEKLQRAHARVPQRRLWADVEVFAWEGPPNQPDSPLIPAPIERARRQLAAVSPHVEKILIYQYQGLIARPGSPAAVGHPGATGLHKLFSQ